MSTASDGSFSQAAGPQALMGGGRGARTIEWAIGLASGALVAALIAFLSWEGLNNQSTYPVLFVSADKVVETEAGWLVELRLANDGDATAADVIVEAELSTGSQGIERATARFDYLPARSERRGGLLFTRDPGRHHLQVRVTGYSEP